MMTIIIIVLVLVGVIVWSIYPAINLPHSSDYTTQDGIEDVIKDEVVEKEIILQKEVLNVEFVKAKTAEKPKKVRQLSEHIATVVENNSNNKKQLNKRQRKTVDKIVKEKKQ
jgi:hypothetical protein